MARIPARVFLALLALIALLAVAVFAIDTGPGRGVVARTTRSGGSTGRSTAR
jgi:hypothetical protein